ncbi:CocE/NonD family hydrolase [Gemmatimonadota bacterium]
MIRPFRFIGYLVLLLATGACAASAPQAGGQGQPENQFGSCGKSYEGPYQAGPVQSLYVTMRDGIRIALDVVLPEGIPEGARIPTILTMTRYWRSWEGDGPNDFQRFFAGQGYAVVWGDSRGTGASFGVWPHHRARDETLDFGEVMDWIVAQPWSDGTIGGWGSSYTANTNDWFAERNRDAFRAGISRFPDYDPYADLYFPGGVPNAYMGSNWGGRVKQMDLNTPRRRGSAPPLGVKPVDEDVDESLVEAAVEARRHVPSVYESMRGLVYKDEAMPLWGGVSMDWWGIHSHAEEVQRSGSAIYSWASWVDAGTAQGVLHRFMTLSNPQRAVIAGWSHGAQQDADPFHPPDHPLDPGVEAQRLEDLCFYEAYLRGDGKREKELVYKTMGEEAWKRTEEWPLPEAEMTSWFFHENGEISSLPPTNNGADVYRVDFSHTTGTRNRWATNNGAGDVVYPDRAAEDAKLLTYTSAPLEEDLEVTGYPILTLHFSSTHEDGAVFAYLEDVTPDGRVVYVGEGQLRLLHRKVSEEEPPFVTPAPYHSYKEADAAPMVPGDMVEVTFALHPTSVLFRRGHRIRVAVGGADADTFARIPAEGRPVWTIARSPGQASRMALPVIPR